MFTINKWIVLILIILESTTLLSQKCYTYQAYSEFYQNIDSIRKQNIFPFSHSEFKTRENLTIPIVFHIVTSSDVNINRDRILAQLDILNRDFSARNGNKTFIPKYFSHLVANMEIQFCLAFTDPDGNPTDGINRRSTTIENIGLDRNLEGRFTIHYAARGGIDSWDPTKYINIWVGDMGEFLGRSTFPNMSPFPEEIGIVIDPNTISFVQNSPNINRSRTLTHELGHFFGLGHIWGEFDSCEMDDGLEDTPNQDGPYFECPSDQPSSCGSTDMFMNYMDFTSDECLAMFTHDQKNVVHQSLQNFYPGLVTTNCFPNHQGDNLNDEIKIVNSGTGPVHLQFRNLNKIYKVKLYDMSGKKIIDQSSFGLNFLNFKFPSGIYILTVSDQNTRINKKLILLN